MNEHEFWDSHISISHHTYCQVWRHKLWLMNALLVAGCSLFPCIQANYHTWLIPCMNSAPLVACRLHSASNFHQSIGNILLENGWLKQAFQSNGAHHSCIGIAQHHPLSLKSQICSCAVTQAHLMLPLCLCIDKSMFIRQCIAWTARIPPVVVNRWYHGWLESFYVHELYPI